MIQGAVNQVVKDVLSKVEIDTVLSDYFNCNHVEGYMKLFSIMIYTNVKNCDDLLKNFYFSKHDLDSEESRKSFSGFLDNILDRMAYCASVNSNNVKELIYIVQHLLSQYEKNSANFLNDNIELIKEGDNLFKILLESGKKKLQ